MKVSWTEHKTNEEILKMVETERKLMDTVRSLQKRWLGHIQPEFLAKNFRYTQYFACIRRRSVIQGCNAARSHPETRLITENNRRRTNTGEEGLREAKNNAFGLATEDRGRQYQLRRTRQKNYEELRPGQVQMESMKTETCHMAEHYSTTRRYGRSSPHDVTSFFTHHKRNKTATYLLSLLLTVKMSIYSK